MMRSPQKQQTYTIPRPSLSLSKIFPLLQFPRVLVLPVIWSCFASKRVHWYYSPPFKPFFLSFSFLSFLFSSIREAPTFPSMFSFQGTKRKKNEKEKEKKNPLEPIIVFRVVSCKIDLHLVGTSNLMCVMGVSLLISLCIALNLLWWVQSAPNKAKWWSWSWGREWEKWLCKGCTILLGLSFPTAFNVLCNSFGIHCCTQYPTFCEPHRIQPTFTFPPIWEWSPWQSIFFWKHFSFLRAFIHSSYKYFTTTPSSTQTHTHIQIIYYVYVFSFY